MLEKELAYYQENLKTWLKQSPGKFVLIKEEELVGMFDTNEEALSAGASRFGLASFLIRRIEKSQEDIKLPALTLGLLYANPAHTTYGTRSDS